MQSSAEEEHLLTTLLPDGEKTLCRVPRAGAETRVVVFPAVLLQPGTAQLLLHVGIPGVAPVRDVPADQEADRFPLPRRQREMSSEHAAVPFYRAGPAGVTAVAERSRGVEVIPVDFEEVAPASPVPVLLKRDLVGVSGEGEFAVVEGVRGQVVVEQELGQSLLLHDPVLRLRILPRIDEGADAAVAVCRVGTVFERDLVERNREGGEIGFPGDKRAPRREARPGGKVRIGEGEFRRREFSVEHHVAEVGEPAERLLAGAPAETVIHRVAPPPFAGEIGKQVAVEDAGRFDPSVPFGTDGEVGTAVQKSFPRMIENFPVDQTAVPGNSYAAGADSSNGKRNLPQCFLPKFHDKKLLSGLFFSSRIVL